MPKVKAFLGGRLLNSPERTQCLPHLTLMRTRLLTVLDPGHGFGAANSVALIPLAGPGQDWALARDGTRLFVSMPTVGKVAVIDTLTWRSPGH